jgi:hypothetical protein
MSSRPSATRGLTMPAKSLSPASIWKALSAINVNDFTEQKAGLTYLSWSHAYRIMMENYPEMVIKWHGTTDGDGVTRDVTYYEGGTAMVSCSVTIGEVSREMWLPVMDYRMKSIEHPSSRDISDAKMRCLVKAFSLFGLANYLYSGDGLPYEDSKPVAKPAAKKTKKKASKKSVTGELSSLIKQIEDDNTLVAQFDSAVLESAKALLEDGTDVDRMQKAASFIKSQL